MYFTERPLFKVLCLVLLGYSFSAHAELTTEKPDIIFLVHGMGRKQSSMKYIERALSKNKNYQIISLKYPSRKGSFHTHIGTLREQVTDALTEHSFNRVHFIGHSLGGLLSVILWSELLDEHKGRYISLGAPFNGSPFLARHMLGEWVMEPFYGEIIYDLENPKETLSHYDTSGSPDLKVLIAGNLCPWYMNAIGPIYRLNVANDCLVTVPSAFDHPATTKEICPLSHEGLLSGTCVIDAIEKWIAMPI